MYGYGNPVKYNDPSGHDPLDQSWQDEFYAAHGRYPTGEDIIIRLFSIAYQDQWNRSNFYNSSGAYIDGSIDSILSNKDAPIAAGRNWSNLANALESMSGWYANHEGVQYTRDVGTLFGGLLNRIEEPNAWRTFSAEGNPMRGWVYLAPDGLDGLTGGDGDSNVHHWAWMVVAGGAGWGPAAELINEAREFTQLSADQYINPPASYRADIVMGDAGAGFGRSMRRLGPRDISRHLWGPINFMDWLVP
jgi:hypothetical protein